MKWPSAIILGLVLVGCAQKAKIIDTKPPAKEGPELTVFFSGCGLISKGYLFCQIQDETDQSLEISLIFPKMDCERQSCIVVQIIGKKGNLGPTLSLKKNQTVLNLKVSDLVGSFGPFSKNDAGEYPIVAEAFYLDNDGNEKVLRMQGLVRLWWLNRTYVAMACDDPDFEWATPVVKNCKGQLSTGGRSALCGICEG